MSTPGGHGADWGDTNTTKWVATAESARREVQALQPYRPDYIKAFADGWRYGQLPEETSMNVETLAALADEAHKHGQRVLTHTVRSEEHTSELQSLMRTSYAVFCSTKQT